MRPMRRSVSAGANRSQWVQSGHNVQRGGHKNRHSHILLILQLALSY